MFAKCKMPGNSPCICCNIRMMAITCANDIFTVKMRKRKIVEGSEDSEHNHD